MPLNKASKSRTNMREAFPPRPSLMDLLWSTGEESGPWMKVDTDERLMSGVSTWLSQTGWGQAVPTGSFPHRESICRKLKWWHESHEGMSIEYTHQTSGSVCCSQRDQMELWWWEKVMGKGSSPNKSFTLLHLRSGNIGEERAERAEDRDQDIEVPSKHCIANVLVSPQKLSLTTPGWHKAGPLSHGPGRSS